MSPWKAAGTGGPRSKTPLRSKELQHFILVVTPAALGSPYVRQEIRLARQEGKTVCPVKGPGLTDLSIVKARLASGVEAWVHVDARGKPPPG